MPVGCKILVRIYHLVLEKYLKLRVNENSEVTERKKLSLCGFVPAKSESI